MRIAINAVFIGTRYTGVATYVFGLIDCLRDLGHEVLVYGSSPYLQEGNGVKLVRTSPRLTFDKGPLGALLRFAWNQTILPFKLHADNVDVIVSQNADGCLWSLVPQLLVVHDLIPLFYPNESARLHRYYKWVLPRALKRAAAIAAVSHHTRNDLIRQYKLSPGKVYVCYNGLNFALASTLADQRPTNLQVERYFLFVGTYAARKNLETVTRALAAVHDQIQESLVVVAYPDRWMRDYLQTVEELGLSDRVVRLTGLSNDELAYTYRHATALFLLSEYEGFGFPALEAMLAGTAAVVSDSTALSEVVGDTAVKISTHDVEGTAKAMLRLCSDEAYRQELERMGTQRARMFTWSRSGATVNAILSRIAQPPRNTSGRSSVSC